MTEGKRFSLVKPTVNTPFHVDFQWWKKNERDWHVYLRSLLCTDHQEAFSKVEEGETIDWVDPVTAEVKPMDGIQNAVITHCVKQPDFLTEQTALVETGARDFDFSFFSINRTYLKILNCDPVPETILGCH